MATRKTLVEANNQHLPDDRWLVMGAPSKGIFMLKTWLSVTAALLLVRMAESVERLANSLERQGIRLAALINNAGIAMEGFDAHVAEHTLAVNFFGPLHVTERLLPLMEEHGRIVMVSSDLAELKDYPHALCQRFDPPPERERSGPGGRRC